MIYTIGDIHCPHDINSINAKNFPEGKTLTKSDYLIFLGDFGLVWSNTPDETEKYWAKWFEKRPWTSLVVPGNHENWARILTLPEEDFGGAKVFRYSDSIKFLKRGEIYTIDGRTFWNFGGANSIDKGRRTKDVSWWSEELASHEEYERGFETLEKVNNKVDYILTHTCPQTIFNKYASSLSQFPNSIFDDGDPTRVYFDAINDLVNFKIWYFGHFHNDFEMSDANKKFICQYEKHKEVM